MRELVGLRDGGFSPGALRRGLRPTRWIGVLASAAVLTLFAAACGSSATEVVADPASTDETADVADTSDASETTDSETTGSEGSAAGDTAETADEPDDAMAADESDDAEPADESEDSGGDPTAEELREIVLDGWQSIFDGDYEDLIPWYTADCRSQLVADDFAVTIGAGIEDLQAFGIDLDDVELDVRIDDFVPGESGGAVTIATLPGESPSEDPPQVWVVEDGEWRNPDCEDIAGASSAGLADGAVGTADNPASIGSIFEFDDWRAGIIEIGDAFDSGLVADFAGTPPDGMSWLTVIYEAQYLGDVIGESEPFIINAVGSSVFDSYSGDCAFDNDALDSNGYVYSGDAVPGQTFTIANCIAVPSAEVGDLRFVLENAFSPIASEVVFSPSGMDAPQLPPADVAAFDLTEGALKFGQVHDFGVGWTATIVAVVDGVAEGLINEFADDPPEGSTYPVIIYEATYEGPELTVSSPIAVEPIGSVIYDSFNSDCWVDADATAAAYGTTDSFEYTSGETFRVASCVTAPLSELSTLAVKVLSYETFDDPVIFVP